MLEHLATTSTNVNLIAGLALSCAFGLVYYILIEKKKDRKR